jgi:2-dehydro-3-deoxyphosphogluconate aldolase / (4S)-4-hydroxy-2-oxoglutarate aldolase
MAGPVMATHVVPGSDAGPPADRRIVAWLAAVRVLPVLTVTDVGTVEATCRALLAGGVSCVEITYRTACADEAITLASRIPGLLVGAGTVTDAGQAAAAAQAGARFAVAPGLSEPVVAAAQEIGLPFFPGVATPSEMSRAASLGCRVLKVFPASSLGGPAFLRSVAAPYPGLRFIPTGGITASTIGEYLELPAVIACGGSWLCDQALVAAGRFDEIRRRAAATRAAAP